MRMRQAVRSLCAVATAAVLVALFCVPADAAEKKKKKKTKAKSVAKYGVPKGGNVTVTYGYHHHLENEASWSTDTNAAFHTPAIPAQGAWSTDSKQKTTTYDGGEANSEWSVTIDNATAGDPNNIIIDVTKLLSEAEAPAADPDSSTTSKERITVSGQITWSNQPGEKVKKEKKKASKKKKVAGEKKTKKTKKSVKDDIKANGFVGPVALALVDLYGDTDGASWSISEDFVELEGITLANYTLGTMAANDAAVWFDMDEYEGSVRLEADLIDGLAQFDAFQEVIQSEALVVDLDVTGGAALTGGVFTPTGGYASLPWALEGAPGSYTAAMLPVSALPEDGWEIERSDVEGDSSFWTTALIPKNITMQIEDVAYDAQHVPEPAGLGLVGLGVLAALRRRRGL